MALTNFEVGLYWGEVECIYFIYLFQNFDGLLYCKWFYL